MGSPNELPLLIEEADKQVMVLTALGGNNSPILVAQTAVSNGTAITGAITNTFVGGSVVSPRLHILIQLVSTTVTAYVSVDGGNAYQAIYNWTGAGTISLAGVYVAANTAMNMISMALT